MKVRLVLASACLLWALLRCGGAAGRVDSDGALGAPDGAHPESSGSDEVETGDGFSGATIGSETASDGAIFDGSGDSSTGATSTCPDPSRVYEGNDCAVPDLICPSAPQTCLGNETFASCACLNGKWTCSVDALCTAPSCPAPELIQPGGVCGNMPSDYSCQIVKYVSSDCAGKALTVALTCACQKGSWKCVEPVSSCLEDGAPPCPDPTTVLGNSACAKMTGPCSGNPHSCDGTTFYDVLECSNFGVWVTLASTVCGSDGGASPSVDASKSDG